MKQTPTPDDEGRPTHDHAAHKHGLSLGHSHEHDEIGEVATDDERMVDRERALGDFGPRAKIIALGATLLVNLVAPSPVTPLLVFLAAVALLLKAGVPAGTVIKRLMVPWYFAAVALLSQALLSGQTPLTTFGPAVVYAEGLARGIQIAAKIIGGTAVVLVFSMTTPVSGMLSAAAWLRMPPVAVEIAALTYRYLFLLAEEADRIREAQRTRLGHSSWRKSIRSYGILGGMVMVNSFDRAERAYQAMLLRGYRGQSILPDQRGGLNRSDYKALLFVATGLAVAYIVGWFLR
ncbi:MAG: cobalt ECF transporter T component CbiQ [Chloroflexota bacterium]